MIGKLFPRRLNKDVEPSLIKPDEMLDALNVLATGEAGADAGKIKRAHGNFEVFQNDPDAAFGSFPGTSNEIVVGYVADESSDRIYYFASSDSSDSIYLMQKFSEDEVVLTLLLRDSDLGFTDFVVADVIKTPKRDLQVSTLDPDISGESGDDTDIFDFDSDDSTTEVVENQTIIVVSSNPALDQGEQFYNFGVDTNSLSITNQIGLTNQGGVAGTVTLTLSEQGSPISGFTETTFSSTGTQELVLTIPGGATIFVNYSTTLQGGVNQGQVNALGGSIDGSYLLSVEQEESVYVAPGNLLSEQFEIDLNFFPFQLNIPKYVACKPTAFGPNAIDEDGLNPNDNALIRQVEAFESQISSQIGRIVLEVELHEDINEPSFTIPPMTLRCTFENGSNSIVGGGQTAVQVFSEDLDFVNGVSSVLEFPLDASDFVVSPTSIDGGSVATKEIYLAKRWDSSSLSSDFPVEGVCRFEVVDENGDVFTQDTPSLGDDSYVRLEWGYTVLDVPTPPQVVGAVDFTKFLEPRLYRIQSKAVTGGTSVSETFTVTNIGETDGWFHLGFDAFSEFTESFLNSFHNGNIANTPLDLEQVAAGWYLSFYSAITINVSNGQGLNFNFKPTLYKNSGSTNFPFWDTSTLSGIPVVHHGEDEATWVPLAAGEDMTVTITIDNTSQAVYPLVPYTIPTYDSSQNYGTYKNFVVWPQDGHFAPPNYAYTLAQKPIDRSSNMLDYVYQPSQDGPGESGGTLQPQINVANPAIMASLFLQQAVSEIIIWSSTANGATGWANSYKTDEGKKMTLNSFINSSSGLADPEVMVITMGYPARSAARLASIDMAGDHPLMCSWFPINPDEPLPPATSQENANRANSDYGQFNKNNIFREFGGVLGQNENTGENNFPDILTLDYPRANGQPIGFLVFSISTLSSNDTIETRLRGNVKESNVNEFGPSSGRHSGTSSPGTFGTSIETSGSFGSAYFGIVSNEAVNLPFASSVGSGSGAGIIEYFNGTDPNAADINSYPRSDFRYFMSLMDPGEIGTSPFTAERITFVASEEDDNLGYFTSPDYGMDQDGNESFGKFRDCKSGVNIPVGGWAYLEPTHGLSNNFYTDGQFSPFAVANENTYEGADGYRVGHQLVFSTGYANSPAAVSSTGNNFASIAQEVVHMKQTYWTYYFTGITPGDQLRPAGPGRDLPPPTPVEGQDGSRLYNNDAPPPQTDQQNSNNQRSLNLQTPSRSVDLNKEKDLKRKGISSKTRRKY